MDQKIDGPPFGGAAGRFRAGLASGARSRTWASAALCFGFLLSVSHSRSGAALACGGAVEAGEAGPEIRLGSGQVSRRSAAPEAADPFGQEAALAQFLPLAAEAHTIRLVPLSGDSVFQAEFAAGQSYVIRLSAPKHDVEREAWVSSIMQMVVPSRTLRVRALTGPERTEFIRLVYSLFGSGQLPRRIDLYDLLDRLNDQAVPANVSVFVPPEAYPTELAGFFSRPARTLAELASVHPRMAAAAWREAFPETFGAAIPSRDRIEALPSEVQVRWLAQIMRYWLPADALRGLAAIRLLRPALGSPDLHSGNWIFARQRVLAIDMADSAEPSAVNSMDPFDLVWRDPADAVSAYASLAPRVFWDRLRELDFETLLRERRRVWQEFHPGRSLPLAAVHDTEKAAAAVRALLEFAPRAGGRGP